MKTNLKKKTIGLSLLSTLALLVFIFLATGSLGFGPNTETKHLGDGVYEEWTAYDEDDSQTITGKRDEYGRWSGPVKIVFSATLSTWIEEVNMVDGKRHGRSSYSRRGSDYVRYSCYNMGVRVDCEGAGTKSVENSTAFQLLSSKYPWFLFALNALDFDDEYVEAYLDTLETILNNYVFEPADFDEYYTDAMEELEETPYDSILNTSGLLSYSFGRRLTRNFPLRLAVLDAYRSSELSTHNLVQSSYPGMLQSLNDAELGEVSEQDFEDFCYELDSCMGSYGVLDPEDPYFIDSVDLYLYRGLTSIEDEESSKSAKWKTTASYLDIKTSLDLTILSSSPKEVAEIVLSVILIKYREANLIYRMVKEAYFLEKGVALAPSVSTSMPRYISPSSVSVDGLVSDDGGAEVLARGVVWAGFYNPEINDNTEAAGSGTGSFSVTLNDLADGTDYYVRSYATNSIGTTYGNCMKFTAGVAMGMIEQEFIGDEISIFPNPASAFTTFRFRLESSASLELSILDVSGRVVLQHHPGTLIQGDNQIEIDLSGLPGGVYYCQLQNSEAMIASGKFIVTP